MFFYLAPPTSLSSPSRAHPQLSRSIALYFSMSKHIQFTHPPPQECIRAVTSLVKDVILKAGNNLPKWSPSSKCSMFRRCDLCPVCGTLYLEEGGAARGASVCKCKVCKHPRYVQHGQLAGKPCAWCLLFDLDTVFKRWFATPGFSKTFNPHHGDPMRGWCVGPTGTLVQDPDFKIKAPRASTRPHQHAHTHTTHHNRKRTSVACAHLTCAPCPCRPCGTLSCGTSS